MTPTRDALTYLRFFRYLAWEFRWSLAVFWGLVLLVGLVFHKYYHEDGKELSYAEGCWHAFGLVFMQSQLPFPKEAWYLQPLFFVVPIIGLGAVADSVVRLGYFVFARKQNLPEWQRMLAAAYRNHIVVVGVGKVGYRTIQGLLSAQGIVVAIERQTDTDLVHTVCALGVPVIHGNGRHHKTLEEAGVTKAKTVIAVTDDDLSNLDAALTAREMNPKIRVVLRLFDETLATKFAHRFDMPAISIALVAAPAFIAAATGRKVYHGFQLDGASLHLTDMTIAAAGSLSGCGVGDIQEKFAVNIVMHRACQGVTVNPTHETCVGPDDTVLVIAPMERLVALEAANHPQSGPDSGRKLMA